MSIEIRKPIRHFVDISLAFSPHPLTGDIPVLRDNRAINASLKNCVMIGVGEKPFNRNFGSQIIQSLFEMCDEITASELAQEIDRSIRYNEPRVKLKNVMVKPIPEENEFQVEIVYLIVGAEEVFTFETILTPTR
jgi:phage baseplate assembly protein W